jgi:hypothetical protein
MAKVYRSLKMIDRDLKEWWEMLNSCNWKHEQIPGILRRVDDLLEERFEVQQQILQKSKGYSGTSRK